MRPSSFSLRHVPLIKFIGGRHPRPTNLDRSVKAHPESHGIIPNGQGTVKISTFTATQPKHATPPSSSSSSRQLQQKSSGLSSNGKPFDFVSVNELPKRFHNAPFEDLEIESVNSGVGFL